MKKITATTRLVKGGKEYQPILVDGVIYWVDEKYDFENNQNEIFAIHQNTQIVIVGKTEKTNLFRYNMKYLKNGVNIGSISKPHKIAAQSSPIIEGIPVITLDSYVERLAENHWKMQYIMGLDDSTKPYIIEDFKAGYNSSPYKWTDADVDKAIDLAQNYNDGWCLTKEEIMDIISSIDVIEVDESFNIIKFS